MHELQETRHEPTVAQESSEEDNMTLEILLKAFSGTPRAAEIYRRLADGFQVEHRQYIAENLLREAEKEEARSDKSQV